MTTLIDTVRPAEAYLESILPDALNGRSEAEYLKAYLATLVDRVAMNPPLYRTYGPWWPAVKTLLITHGHDGLGLIVDNDVAEIYCMNRPALTLLAAHLYADERVENDAVYNPVHALEVASYADDTEPYLFTSYDESIEKYKILKG